MADNLQVPEGTDTRVMGFDEVDIGGNTVLVQRVKPVVGDDGTAVDVGKNQAMPIGSERVFLKEAFKGTSLSSDPDTGWTVATGTGQTATVASSVLTVAAGTTANAVTTITSNFKVKVPARVTFIAQLSQRIANQEFYLELISAADNTTYASWMFDGVTTTSQKIVTANANVANGPTAMTTAASSTYVMWEIDLNIDEASFRYRTVDSTAGAIGQSTKTRLIPDPNDDLQIRIRVKNLGTAPATNTNLLLDSVIVQDINELYTEITSSRGSLGPNNALGVQLVGTATVNTQTVNTFSTESTTNIAAAGVTANTTIRDQSGKNSIMYSILADQPGTLTIECSTSSTFATVRQWSTYTSVANVVKQTEFIQGPYRYWRAKWTNTGASTTTLLELLSVQYGAG